jgi:TetR/AcrR family transcriptional repressor of nem operon
MARPRSFDLEQVLDSALEAFWQRGFSATSMSDLCSATGLGKGSLYQAFGDKESLYLAALGRYLNGANAKSEELLSAGDTPLDSLRHWLEQMAHGICTDNKGCFAVNALVEQGPSDGRACQLLADYKQGALERLAEVVRAAQAAGQLDASRDPMESARYLMTLANGLAVQGRHSLAPRDGAAVVRLGLETLGAR